MLDRIAAVVHKEFRHLLADRQTMTIILLMPPLHLLLFGYAVNIVVDHLPTVVFDAARDPESRALVSAMRNSDYFDVKQYVASYEEAVAAIEDGEARVAICIPSDFGLQVLRHRTAAFQLLVDGTDPNIAQAALFAAQSIARANAARLADETSERTGQRPIAGDIELRPVVLFNPRMLSAVFVVPGLIGIILWHQALSLTAQAIVRERELGTLEQLNVTPIQPWELMVGKAVPYAAIALATVMCTLAIARLVFSVAVEGSLVLLSVLCFLFLLGSLATGLLISTVSQTQWQARQIADLVTLPALLLTGFIFPREAMPLLVQHIGLLFPLTYFLQILRGIILKGVGLDVLWPQIWPLAAFSIVAFAASSLAFRKRRD